MTQNKITQINILAWIIFAIPTGFIVHGSYILYLLSDAQGFGFNPVMFIAPTTNIFAWFFCSRFFVEYAKRKMHERESDRLRARLYKEYPETLEELEP